jgi:hypothetical protein
MQTHGTSGNNSAALRWVLVGLFVFAAACFGLSWWHTHTVHAALSSAGFLAVALRNLGQPLRTQATHTKYGLLLGIIGLGLVIAGTWLQ